MLFRSIRSIESAGADYIHIDVMDGRFVPNITFGPVVCKRIREITSLPLDVHLMILEPERVIAEWVELGASIISIQAESTAHLDRALRLVRQLGAKASVAINPATSLESVYPVLSIVDQVLIMSVNPGFGGQTFISYTLEKIKTLRNVINQHSLFVDIQVDGGVNESNAAQIARAGADVLVAGSAVFQSKDRLSTVKALKNPV